MTDQEQLEHFQSPLEERSEHAVNDLDSCVDRLREIIKKREGLRFLRREGGRLQDINERFLEFMMELSARQGMSEAAE